MREDITELLQKANEGSREAVNALWAAVNDELRALAQRHIEREFGSRSPGVTLQPTALVNETYLRLIKQRAKFDNRGHFFAVATKVLIRVLCDYERERKAAKRGSGWVRVTLDPDAMAAPSNDENEDRGTPIEELVAALEKLENLDARKAEVVKLRVFWGLTIEEAAKALDVGHATIERDWEFARAWLNKSLAP